MPIWTEAPEIRCGNCGHRFPFVMHWEIEVGHVLECHEYEAHLEYLLEESIRRWHWGVKQTPEQSGDEK